MILVFGSLNIDLVTLVPVIPGPGRTVLAPSYATHFGGKGANQAVAAARIAGAGKVAMAGRVGKDGFGDEAIRNLCGQRRRHELIVRANEPTGCAFITVDGSGENAITVASGANMAARAADVPAQHLTADTVLVLQMEVPFTEALAVARRTRAASGRVVWNLAPVPERMTREMIRDLLEATDYLITNEHEALDAATALGAKQTDFEAAARIREGRPTQLHRDRRLARRLRVRARWRPRARAVASSRPSTPPAPATPLSAPSPASSASKRCCRKPSKSAARRRH